MTITSPPATRIGTPEAYVRALEEQAARIKALEQTCETQHRQIRRYRHN
jgi:hypothetical protein